MCEQALILRAFVCVACGLQAANTGTPCLLVRGSGKAADLISDAVMLQFRPGHPAHVRQRDTSQQCFWEFLTLCGVEQEAENSSGCYHWGTVCICMCYIVCDLCYDRDVSCLMLFM